MKKLEKKVAIIVGATSGIGAASAKLFAENGATVIISGRNKKNGLTLEKEIGAFDRTALFIECDVTKETDIIRLIQTTVDKFGRIDILFNNAGVFFPSVELDRLELDVWKETYDVNLTSCFLVIKHARIHLLASKGVILNTSSVAGMHSYAVGRAYPYSTSKAAMIQFTRMLAKNYASEGIRVNCLCPGTILTPMLHGRDSKTLVDRIPIGRVGTPDDVAKAALFLASDDAAYLTGVVLPVDGGSSL
jgi:NAD(P)-dependent dehydrogenase (short-subunit alcohol dehydrogenase family)